jgi:GH25 family lysozyme M1 (1,4-beta-N-acetylmuramidase)
MKIVKKFLFIFVILLLIFSLGYLAIADSEEIVVGSQVLDNEENIVLNEEESNSNENSEEIIIDDSKSENSENEEQIGVLAQGSDKISVNDEDPESNNAIQNVTFSATSSNKSVESIDTLISRFASSGNAVIGIDVSSHQGKIDWKQVAASGAKFAIIRCGYRGATEGGLIEDDYFAENIKGALNNGLYVGIYFYSMAITENEAIEEAQFTLNLISGYDIKYPVIYDFEDFTDSYGSKTGTPYRTNGLSYEQMNKNAKAYLSYIKSKGYNASMYGSAYNLRDIWDMSSLSEYDTWVAHYYVNKPNYSGKYTMWQYTDSGRVSGISENVDIDVDYTYYFKYHDIDITSYLFDATYYADRYEDLKRAFGYDEAKLKNHYLKNGIKEGRSASPVFDPIYYLNKYSDLKKAFGNNYTAAYNHFINCGIKEGRQGSKYFDANYYLNTYSDIKRVYYSSKTYALVHFMKNGISEGRIGSSDFNATEYKNTVSKYYQNNLGTNYKKYMALDAGGKPIFNDPINITSYLFDATYYANKYSDLKKAFGYDEAKLKNHYLNYGIKEGRSASPVFDPQYYLNKYSDLKKAFGNNYTAAYNHFISNGINEGRQGSKDFDVQAYYNNYSDLRNAFDKNYSKLLRHYVQNGIKEGRSGI